MSAPFIIPFNFQPVNTGASSSTYTVPLGKYARITATLTTTAYPSSLDLVTGQVYHSVGNSNTTTFSIWLKSGDAVSVSNTAASRTSSVTDTITGISTALLKINSNTVASCSSAASFGSSSAFPKVIAGTSVVNYFYEEYNEIS